ncbi:MAG: DUF5130 family protein [Mycobacteriales bacterium]
MTGSHDPHEHTEVQQGPQGVDDHLFTPAELARIDEALTLGSEESGLYFSVYIGHLDVPARGHAERLHAQLGPVASRAVLIAVSPGQRTVEIVTGEESSLRLPDNACALAALSMTAAFGAGDLAGGIATGLRMLSDRSGHPVLR